MNDEYFHTKIKQHLNSGLNELSPNAVSRLHIARTEALLHQKRPVPVLSFAGLVGVFNSAYSNNKVRGLFLSFLLCIGVVFYVDMLAEQEIRELGELDSALLSGELPVAAYTDVAFSYWLNASRANLE